ncbi:Mitochondrial carrier domain [Pseudocohnilembus persalinus]|uniref:Mitochondrial carrier domain n=1 Tax=Pseudocohnilembus persalinus TaxID=266149 RepID=A0A0V0QB26_PSEPJ|nr:Mitochondrial carrier domain [Pseudocohnilembus persalinus]|eukprot:KRW99343.1 Mitochondrial carrier domain [Pseudocohnilembus persalinus]
MQGQIENKEKQNNQHGGIGFVAGIVVGTFLQPLEIIKIGLIIGPANNPELAKQLHKGNILRHTYLIINHIYKTEGIKGFFRSYIPSVFRNGGGSGVYFYTLQELDKAAHRYVLDKPESYAGNLCKILEKKDLDSEQKQQVIQQINDKKENTRKQFHFINSALARMASTVAINPVSVVGSRIEVPGFNEYSGMRDGFKQVYQKEGFRAFFKGTWASCLKDGPFAGLYLVIYRYIKEKFRVMQQNSNFQMHYTTVSMISGMTAGFCATLSSHPLEIIRARLQINQNSDYKNGIIKEFKNIYKEDGLQGYFRGITPRLVKKPIANSLTFVVFEAIHYSVFGVKW